MIKRTTTALRRIESGVWVYYLIFIASFLSEGVLIKLLENLGGAAAAFIGIAAGSAVLGLWELRRIDEDKPLHDPLLIVALKLTKMHAVIGFILNAVLFGGGIGVAIVGVKLRQPRIKSLIVIAAILFAVVWVPIWYLLLP